jgi:hypothetical protein
MKRALHVYEVLSRNLFVNQIALPKVSIRPASDFTVTLSLLCPSYIDKPSGSILLAIGCNKNGLFAIDKKGKCPLYQASIYNLNAVLISVSSVFSTYELTLSYGAFVSISFLNCAKSLPTLVIAADIDVSCFASLNIS